MSTDEDYIELPNVQVLDFDFKHVYTKKEFYNGRVEHYKLVRRSGEERKSPSFNLVCRYTQSMDGKVFTSWEMTVYILGTYHSVIYEGTLEALGVALEAELRRATCKVWECHQELLGVLQEVSRKKSVSYL